MYLYSERTSIAKVCLDASILVFRPVSWNAVNLGVTFPAPTSLFQGKWNAEKVKSKKKNIAERNI